MDDCSSDDTYAKLLEIQARDERIKLYKNNENCGAAVTRNVGLDHATGDYIAFLDSDDLWERAKLEKQVAQVQAYDVDFSYHNYQTVDESGHKLKELVLSPSYTSRDLLKFNPFATSSILIRKKIIANNNIRFKEHLRRRQDYFFWYDAIGASRRVAGIPENLSRYRLGNASSLSANKLKMAQIQWKLYRTEFKLGLIKSLWYTFHYAIHGLKKYVKFSR